MAENYINRFKKKGTEEYYDIVATSASTSLSAETSVYAETAGNVNAIGKVEKYSGNISGKTREGLKIVNNAYTGSNPNYSIIEMNSNGNLALESLAKHVNIEAKQAVQIKPTTNVIFDSSRRILNSQGNEVHLEAKFDDFKSYNKGEAPEYNGYSGNDEQWAELKIHSRNVDLRCHEHGGIALQVAGCDHYNNTGASVVHHENKIKFESSRKTPIQDNYSVTKNDYLDEGGKGMEFGTFNNEHASLYCGDYRFKKNAKVYGVTRDALENTYDSTGKLVKVDYPTQEDDFKDVINETTPNATWNEIIDAANKCKNKEAIASEDYVDSKITERIVEIEGGGSISLDGYATTEYVNNAIAAAGGGSALVPGNGISIADGEISVNHYDDIEPLTALTNSTTALNCVKIGKDKGNFKIDVKGKYTYEANVDATDEYGNEVLKGGRVVNYSDEDFYNDPDKYYYKALVNGLTYDDNSQNAQKGACAYKHEAFPSVSVGSYFYIAKKNAKMYPGDSSSQIMTKGDVILQNGMTSEEISYYDGVTADTKWTKGYILKETDNEAFYSENSNWEKTALWIKNEINVNLETDSKIKFDGAKIETTWDYPEIEGGEDVSHKMEEISLSTEDLVVDATQVSFESKVTKNGDFVDDTNIVYVFDNKLLDENGDAVIDVDTFRSNYRGKHPQSELTDEEVNSLYSEYIAKGKTETISARISDLLKLVSKVSELESRIAALENQN